VLVAELIDELRALPTTARVGICIQRRGDVIHFDEDGRVLSPDISHVTYLRGEGLLFCEPTVIVAEIARLVNEYMAARMKCRPTKDVSSN